MNIANMLTFLRILLGPVFIAVFFQQGIFFVWASLIIVCVIEITDILDGYLARARKEVTDLGKIIDPLADKISHYSIFLSFACIGYANVWMIAIIFYRDTIVSSMRMLAAARGLVLAARASGKIKTCVQGAAIIIILLLQIVQHYDYVAIDIFELSNHIMWVVTIVTAISAIEYIFVNRKILAEIINSKSNSKDVE